MMMFAHKTMSEKNTENIDDNEAGTDKRYRELQGQH